MSPLSWSTEAHTGTTTSWLGHGAKQGGKAQETVPDFSQMKSQPCFFKIIYSNVTLLLIANRIKTPQLLTSYTDVSHGFQLPSLGSPVIKSVHKPSAKERTTHFQ